MAGLCKEFKTCSALGCPNKETDSSDVYFFPFPAESERCLQWLLMCNRKDLICCSIETLNSDYFVCSKHFQSNSFVKNHKKLLKATSMPTLSIEKDLKNINNDTHSVSVEDNDSFQVLDEEMPLESDIPLKEINIVIETPKISLNICRLCSESVIETSCMLNVLANPNILDQINQCLPIKINPMDTLPKCICSSCFERLKIHFEFYQVVMESENILKEMFADSNKIAISNENSNNLSLVSPQFVITDLKNTKRINYKHCENDVPCMNENSDNVQDSCETNSEKLLTLQIENKTKSCTDTSFKTNIGCNVENRSSLFDATSSMSSNDEKIEIENKTYNCDTNVTKSTFESTKFYTFEKNYYICSFCNKKFISQQRLERHIKFHINEKPGHCNFCDKIFPNENLLYRHLWYLHGGGRKVNLNNVIHKEAYGYKVLPTSGGKCLTCGKAFSDTTARLAHEEAHHSIVRECYRCFMCDEAFATEELVEKHHLHEHSASIQVDHAMKPIIITRLFQCEYCFKLYTKTSALGDHRNKYHSLNPVYSCRFCKENFIRHNDLLSHIANSSNHPVSHLKEDYPERPLARKFFCCRYCTKMYQSFKSMMDHITRHINVFEKLSDQNEAQDLIAGDIHQSDVNLPLIPGTINGPSFTCNYCSKEFSDETSLSKHIRSHTGEKPYRCDLCGKCFAQSSTLTTHRKVHSDERPYSCLHCPQSFKIKSDRDNHEKKHSSQRPYKCKTCSKTFKTQSIYSQHCKIHTNQRPHVCQICNKEFRRSYVLKVHMLRHSGEKPHNCHVCDQNFRQKQVLKKHLKIKHGIIHHANVNAEEK